jgi:2'-5' RNA ligase
VFAGLDTEGVEVTRAASGARPAASRAGIAVDGQRFRPHVTLARMNRPVEATRWVRVLDAYTGPTWTIAELALVASYLGEGPRGRPRHEVLETFDLKG